MCNFRKSKASSAGESVDFDELYVLLPYYIFDFLSAVSVQYKYVQNTVKHK